MQRSVLLTELRVKVTGASVDYVGSITIHEEFCDALGLLERQMVHIRNERTGVDLWTYVIRGDNTPAGTVCLNGAAAHLVQVGDVVSITAHGLATTMTEASDNPRQWDAVRNGVTQVVARMGKPSVTWADNVMLEYARGKVHRPRVTEVVSGEENNVIFPGLILDSAWAQEGGLCHGESVHVVSVTNGQRDILTVRHAPKGSQQCAIHMGQANQFATQGYGSRPGYQAGDIIIAMNYGYISRADVLKGKAPSMKICFPFERPAENPADDDFGAKSKLYQLWDKSANNGNNNKSKVTL
ncbi:Aspartate 1-decarboxylase [Seminavis robusta]|uniref:Aspartate 1-decarboxylase n=1 Tax=Seminavis robusta TaxID=568900 RepID=A0A9N8DZ52_9STRA|nr:Aspartate 1-decarboxylase [Seminavis robusta]|eukprot:Sro392_g133260.1 Aspartate 1-decarboxylase (297) ;mRNA; f:2746-3636